MVSGEIIAGPHVRNACRRHLDDLRRSDGICFDPDAAAHAFGFFEEVLKLSEGQFEGQPFRLERSQAFIIGSLFGWKRVDGRRRFRRAYIEQGKGNGKSPVAGGIGLFGMTAAGEAGAQIYAAAAKREQAGILFADAVKMVRQSPALAWRPVSRGVRHLTVMRRSPEVGPPVALVAPGSRHRAGESPEPRQRSPERVGVYGFPLR